ncbi:hypothetical protein A3F56_00370 [Candidatus Kaiserbacteria bacterium RIFCSPHIGHO2_12_FULL_55_13]|nr:MAG: hypothetical protein A3F56_00370 [Candidatus Kaiserbacteria bacterium RIFCSPHIGHO2_12_FULL_55_13]
MSKFKSTLSLMWLPIFAFAAFASFYAVWGLLGLPPQAEVIELARGYFQTYGLITVFICAMLEAMLLVGWYFPGSLVIVLAVVVAGNDIAQVIGVAVVTTLGFLVAYTFNYFMGEYGWYKLFAALGFREPLEKAQKQLTKYGPRAIFLTYWHPNLGALTATAAGILFVPFRTFIVYSIGATVVWDTFWTIVGYTLGNTAITVIGPKFVVAFIALWIACIFIFRTKSEAAKAALPPV